MSAISRTVAAEGVTKPPLAIRKVFEAAGGWATGDEVASRMRTGLDQPVSALARLITTRRVVSFRCQADIVLPLFQFEPGMRVRDDVANIIAELAPVYDDLELAAWFSRPNPWLENATPVEAISADLASVVNAARADRFIAAG